MNGAVKKIGYILAKKLNLTLDNSVFEKNAQAIQKYNLRLLRQITLLSGTLILVMFLGNYVHQGLIINQHIYFAFMMLSAIVFVLTYVIFNHLIPYSTVLMYFFTLVFAAFATFVGIAEPVSGTEALFMIFLAMLPMQIVDKQTHVIAYTVLVWLAFCAASLILKEHDSAVADVISASVALIFGILNNRLVFKARISAINDSRILARSTEIDSITGLMNYEKFDNDLSGKNGSSVAQSLCSLSILEIDNFKEYNEKYGRQAGDKCLKKIGACLQRISEPGELIIYRYGGTGFAAVSLIHDYNGIERVSKGILALIRGLEIEYNGTSTGIVTFSAGYADVMECECDDYKHLIEMSLEGLNKAKSLGGNTHIGYLELHPKENNE